MNQTNQKIALVTGCNRGIGLELCKQLVEKGYQVIATTRDEKNLISLQSKLPESCDVYVMDINSSESIAKACTQFKSKYTHIDLLINNAAILPDHSPGNFKENTLYQTTREIFELAMSVNAWGTLDVCRAFSDIMKSTKEKPTLILNISSLAGQIEMMRSGWPAYKFSKLVLNGITKILAQELSSQSTYVVSVSPGWVQTDMGGASADLTVEESVTGLLEIVFTMNESWNGKFINKGKVVSW